MKYLPILGQIKVLLELLRVRNCVMGFLGVLLTVTLLHPGNALNSRIFLAGIPVFLIMGAGNMINDYFDSEIDKINKPYRPIPSRRINKNETLMLSLALFFLGIALAKNINAYCFGIAILNSLFLISYGKYSKKLLLVSNFGVSYLVASIFVFGALAPAGLNITGKQVEILIILTACAFFMTFSREIIKDIEDMEGDRANYAVTLATHFGKNKAKKGAVFFALIAIIISLLPFFLLLNSFHLLSYGFLIISADLIFLISLTMHPSLSQRLMVLGMALGLGAFFLGETLDISYFFSL
jgi:geranylgeranylglycerol-phosphate geranylgeranyltransferase